MTECRTLGGCATGDAKLTAGYDLPARHVIHTVGPIWRGGGQHEDELLASCYRRSLELAEQYGLRTIAFASISTGVYGFPIERAATIAITEIRAFLAHHKLPEVVTLVTFSPADEDIYRRALAGQGYP